MPRKPRARKAEQQPQSADESRAFLDRQVAEAELQKNVIDLAHALNFLVFHTYDSVLGSTAIDPGFPDLILAKEGRIIAAELKKERGKVSMNQAMWLTELAWLGRVETYVWRPSHWSSGEIETVLKSADGQRVA